MVQSGLVRIRHKLLGNRIAHCREMYAAAGAIVVEWNVHEPRHKQGGAGMWDSHIRLGGVLGTKLDLTKCGKGNLDPNCSAAFMSLHLAPDSSAYLEGTWVWTADHDLDHDDGHGSQISLFSGRGIFSESSGPVWMVGAGCELVG